MVALAATDRRLIVQGLNRRFEPDGDPHLLEPADVTSAKADGAGGGWPQISAAIMDMAVVKLQLRTAHGEKIKLTLMRATGPLAGAGGGETQRKGLEAVAAFLGGLDEIQE